MTITSTDLSWVSFSDPVPCEISTRNPCENAAVWETLWRSWDGEERSFNLCDECLNRADYPAVLIVDKVRISD